jgi:hypothetical protein
LHQTRHPHSSIQIFNISSPSLFYHPSLFLLPVHNSRHSLSLYFFFSLYSPIQTVFYCCYFWQVVGLPHHIIYPSSFLVSHYTFSWVFSFSLPTSIYLAASPSILIVPYILCDVLEFSLLLSFHYYPIN